MSQVFSSLGKYVFGWFGLLNWFLLQQLTSWLPNVSGQFLYPQKRPSLHWSSKVQGPSSTPNEKHALNPMWFLLALLQSTEIHI